MSGATGRRDESPPPRYERSPGAVLKAVGEDEAVYVGESRALHVLNPTARLLFHCLDQPATIAELALLLEQLTDAPRSHVERDLAEVLPELERIGIVRRAV